MRELTLLLVLSLLFLSPAIAQSPTATINGIVLDPSGAAIAGAQIVVVNDATGVQYTTKANGEGVYVVPNLPPGPYRIQVSNTGFKTIIKPDIVIHVQDALAINFTLPIGATSEIVTVTGGTPLINTESAAVSTVVDQTYVKNMPLNGRSFQDLILLAPGVVTNTPQSPGGTPGAQGEFSVNGQRTEANYYSVDGVSANTGIFPGGTQFPSTNGSLPSSTALGTTQSLVSVDALQEFRVQTSSYSAEFGRTPGGQISFETKSGANQVHGSASEYLRNDVFDANDWFNNFQGLSKPPERQNDFGVTLGGPLEIPRLYNGKDKTFFFFSYEGLRLAQPQEASVSYVPTAALRTAAPSALQPVLNAFPQPRCPSGSASCTTDLGNGLGEFVSTWSNPSSLDSYSIRFDQAVSRQLRLFFRFAQTGSLVTTRTGGNGANPSSPGVERFSNFVYTLGASSVLSPRLSNGFRFNYTSNQVAFSEHLDNFGGATPVNLATSQGLNPNSSYVIEVGLIFNNFFPVLFEEREKGLQRQWNLLDNISYSVGRHQLKVGVDYRRLSPTQNTFSPSVNYFYLSASSVQGNSVDSGSAFTTLSAYPIYTNMSAFVQDEWHATSRLNLSAGLRWEVNPAPTDARGNLPYTVEGNSLSTLTLAPKGTSLWNTTWFNFAPRMGAAYALRNVPGGETIIRGGGGVFFDTGQQDGAWGYNGPGFEAQRSFGTLSGGPSNFPIPIAIANPPVVNPPVPPYNNGLTYAFPRHLQLPYTLQWNVSLQQAMGRSQALTLSYIGANGRRLLEENLVHAGAVNPNFNYVEFFQNGLTSSYNSLQSQFQRRLMNGLQVLASYTWAHSLDYGSSNTALPYKRGNSDFDVRHSASVALSYDVRPVRGNQLLRHLVNGWGVDDRFGARSAFPVNLTGFAYVDPVTNQRLPSELNLIPGVPIYQYGAQFPGGREINPDAFSQAVPGTAGNAPRNFARGFGAWQMDIAARRDFSLYERLKLQFRAEAFNVLNHPNFGTINSTYCAAGPFCTFGQATGTLAHSLGVLSPLYQMGGPRSMQFALKLTF